MPEWRADGTHDDLLPDFRETEEEGWLISYLDVLTLILALLVLLLSMSRFGGENEQAPTIGETVSLPFFIHLDPREDPGILPATSGLMPRYKILESRIQALALDGVDATPDTDGMVLRIADHLLFDSGQADLTMAGEEVISRLAAMLADYGSEISVEGHSDDQPIQTPRFPSNWELSSARAISVVRFLEKRGLDPGLMRAVGYADTQPVATNATAAGRARNRRVELVLREPELK